VDRHSRSAKCGNQIGWRALVVPRLVSPAVRQVGGVKKRLAAIEIVEPQIQERFEVEEMAGMLLNRPPAFRPVHTDVRRHLRQDSLDPPGRPGQPIQQRRSLGDRHPEHEAAIEPAFHAPKW
jgi:hypothetical protein